MTDPVPLHSPDRQPDDPDAALRPKTLAEFVGQAAGTLAADALIETGAAPAASVAPAPVPARAPSGAAQADALSALTNLGYGPSDAARAVAEASGSDPEAEAPALIRAALRLLAPKD